jgi:hypothetical protein
MPHVTLVKQLWSDRRRRTEMLVALAGCACCALLTFRTVIPAADIIKTAVCTANKKVIDCNSGGLDGLTSAADGLVSPALVALIAVCPIACLVGAAAVMFGNRRGLVIIGSALGALVFAGAIKGIVA